MSFYQRFEKREEFSFGVKELDDVIRGKSLDSSWILYQEQIMQLMIWLGFPMKEAADLMKAISKKKIEKIVPIKEIFTVKLEEKIREDIKVTGEELTDKEILDKISSIWQVIEDASAYSFNASHSLNMAYDSLYIAWAKAHYPNQTMKALLSYFTDKKKRDKIYDLQLELEQLGITLPPLKFRQDNRNTVLDGDSIITSLKTVKTLDDDTAEIMYKNRNFQGTLEELIIYLWKEEKVDLGKLKALAYIGYFEEFGSIAKVLWILSNFKTYKQLSMTSLNKLYEANKGVLDTTIDDLIEELKMSSTRYTEKTIMFDDELAVFRTISNHVEIKEITELEKLYREVFYIGAIKPRDKKNIVCNVVKYKENGKSALLYDVSTGVQEWLQVPTDSGIKEKDIIYITSITSKEWKNRVFKSANRIINLTKMFK